MPTELPQPRNASRVELSIADPSSIRDATVSFWKERGLWPDWPLEKHYAMWDWRHRALSDGPPEVLVARSSETGRIVGHAAIYQRFFTLNGVRLSVGIPGNLALNDEFQGGVAGANLASFPSRQLRRGRYDAIIAFANKVAHEIFVQLGARDLGVMTGYRDIRRTRSTLRNRSPLLAPLSFVLDAGLSVRRSWLRHRTRGSVRIDVHEVDAGAFRQLDRSHWVSPRNRVVAADSVDYIVRRYLECPYVERRAYALLDSRTGSCEGYIITQGDTDIDIWDVQVNGAALDVSSAILSASRAFAHARSVAVSALPDSLLSQELRAAGFLKVWVDGNAHYPRFVDGAVRRDHPLSDQLSQFTRWNLWTGTTQY